MFQTQSVTEIIFPQSIVHLRMENNDHFKMIDNTNNNKSFNARITKWSYRLHAKHAQARGLALIRNTTLRNMGEL